MNQHHHEFFFFFSVESSNVFKSQNPNAFLFFSWNAPKSVFFFHCFSFSFDCLIHTFHQRKMRRDLLVWIPFVLAFVALVCSGQSSDDGKYEIDVLDWPLNGVPYVSEGNETYPTYEERAALVWSGVVCFFFPSLFHAHTFALPHY